MCGDSSKSVPMQDGIFTSGLSADGDAADSPDAELV